MIRIEEIRKEHLDQIVEIFFMELNSSVLSLLGKRFIRKNFINLMKDNLGFISISEKSEITGFIFMKKKRFFFF